MFLLSSFLSRRANGFFGSQRTLLEVTEEVNWDEDLDWGTWKSSVVDKFFEEFENVSYLFQGAVPHAKLCALTQAHKEELTEFVVQARVLSFFFLIYFFLYIFSHHRSFLLFFLSSSSSHWQRGGKRVKMSTI